ncbi:MAG: DUF2971 domain-containing protein [Chloroflexi bacterium]|nr:DUF2971 domain-containing protein [Chloroflexota bacterium]
MSNVFSREPQPGEVYRFRSIDALIGPHKELSRQTIYLARPDELNDLAEDTVNVVWRGDDVLWANLVTYYWRSLLLSTTTGAVFLPGYHFIPGRLNLEDPPLGPLIDQGVAHLQRQHETQRVTALTELGQSKQPVSGYELRTILSTLTPRVLQPASLFPNPSVLEKFPERFVQALGKILLSEWGVACFTNDFTNPFLWSSYADNHSGVCLVFERSLLEGLGAAELSPGVELEDVTYDTKKPEIEFFANLPRLTVSEYSKLFMGEDGTLSPLCPFLPEDREAIEEANARQQAFARKNLLLKQKYWEAEQEVRMFNLFYFHGRMHSDPSEHTVQYPIGALKGIIFGSRMAEADRQAVLDVILSKHYVSPMREDFCFWEAELQPNGSIFRNFYPPYIGWRQEYIYPRRR